MEERYSRQIRFKPIDIAGQEKINRKHVLIIGCGALGSANAESLVRAGIGKITILDRDYVEESNLQRQQLFVEKDAKDQVPKAIAARNKLIEINSSTSINAHVVDVTANSLTDYLDGVDVVIDATDNFDIRFILNDILQQRKIPWIFGSCVGSTGMSFTIIPEETPCLQCLLSNIPLVGTTCDVLGVISPAVQMVVAHQVTETLKLLVNAKANLRTSYLTFDLWQNYYQTIEVDRAKKAECPTCGDNPNYPALKYQSQTKTEVLCGRDTVQIRRNKTIPLAALAEHLKSLGKVKQNDFLVSIVYYSYRVVFFQDGRTFIHGTHSIEKAKQIYYQLVG